MSVEEILNIVLNFKAGFFLKPFFLLFALGYAIFALMVIRQVGLMEKTLTTQAGPVLKFMAILHAGVAMAFFFIVLGIS